MIIGFTGTQSQLTLEQFDALVSLVKQLDPSAAHHGDCVGADAIFHAICSELNIPIIIHPPKITIKRAYCEGATVVNEPKDYLVRNHNIVNECDALIACPWTETEQRRSGTWATWRYANKQNKTIYLILPDGTIK